MSHANWTALFSDLSQMAEDGDSAGLRQRLWQAAQEIRSYLLSFRLQDAPPDLIDQYVGDALARFLRTWEFVPLPCHGTVLEVGSNPYLFHLLIKKILSRATLEGCNYFDHNIFAPGGGNLKQRMISEEAQESYDFSSKIFNLEVVEEYPYEEGYFDLVFFCETLEHLVVNPLAVFGRLKRIIRSGGHLIVTLPNAVRLTNVALMLEGRNFFDVYSSNGPHGRHNREYTLEEVTHLLSSNGYEIVRAETWDRCDYDLVPVWSFDYAGPSVRLRYTRSSTVSALEGCGGTLQNRGDNLYVLARRP